MDILVRTKESRWLPTNTRPWLKMYQKCLCNRDSAANHTWGSLHHSPDLPGGLDDHFSVKRRRERWEEVGKGGQMEVNKQTDRGCSVKCGYRRHCWLDSCWHKSQPKSKYWVIVKEQKYSVNWTVHHDSSKTSTLYKITLLINLYLLTYLLT